METETATAPQLAALADTDINWDRLDKARFHIIGAILFTLQSALIHPTAVVKTRMQVAGSGLSQMTGFSVFRHIIRSDGIPGIFRGFGTSAVGSLPGRVLALTSLEVSKDMMLKYTQGLNMSEPTSAALANGFAGMVSNLLSCVYFVPLDVICQRLMVQGIPGTKPCAGPFDATQKVLKAEGIRGIYRGFGLTAVTQSPAQAIWWGAYGAAQHISWRNLGYSDNTDKKPSHMQIVAVQATSGLAAGACSSVITTPIDTVKTRLQVIDDYGVGRPSVLKTTKTLLREDGWKGFYRGFGPRFLNMSFYGTTMIVTYEIISLCLSLAALKDSFEMRSSEYFFLSKHNTPWAADSQCSCLKNFLDSPDEDNIDEFDFVLVSTRCGLGHHIDGSAVIPDQVLTGDQPNPAYHVWLKQDQLVLGWIVASVSEGILPQLVGAETAHKAWSKLVAAYASGSKPQIRELKIQLHTLQRDNASIETYVQHAKGLADKLVPLQHLVTDDDLVEFIVADLGPTYRPFTRSLESRQEDISFDALYELLLNEERQLKRDEALNVIAPTTQFTHTSVATNRGRDRAVVKEKVTSHEYACRLEHSMELDLLADSSPT
ncbi:hypothetical protein KY290_003840 [Solanum tuberosum]|uniref:Mitochondrial carrier protein n=1 Tax=Solanum tuberosum TaxID=4113 RepID=A0ABQ7WU07_SOLTU|nr:hypothetical protein KY290_003840 [Solanum tuberosum]